MGKELRVTATTEGAGIILPELTRKEMSTAASGGDRVTRGVRMTDEEALATINRELALAPLLPGDVVIRTMALCNDVYDRSFEKFSPAVLQRLAETLPGKSVLAHHSHREFPLGRFFNTYLAQDIAGTSWLMAQWYALKGDETDATVRNIDGGVYAYVSVGFRGGDPFCDICNSRYYSWRDCSHWAGDFVERVGVGGAVERVRATVTWHDPNGDCEAVEGSLVWLGCQIGARNVKALLRGDEPRREKEARVECDVCKKSEERIAELTQTARALGDQVKAFAGKEAELTLAEGRNKSLLGEIEGNAKALTEAAERIKALEAQVAEMTPLCEEGKLYRADLVAEITRLGALVGAEKEASVVAGALAIAGAAALKAQKDEYQKRVDDQFPVAAHGVVSAEDEAKAQATKPGAAMRHQLV